MKSLRPSSYRSLIFFIDFNLRGGGVLPLLGEGENKVKGFQASSRTLTQATIQGQS